MDLRSSTLEYTGRQRGIERLAKMRGREGDACRRKTNVKQMSEKYERNPTGNPTGKYCCVKRPKLGEGRKAALQPHSVHLCEVGQ